MDVLTGILDHASSETASQARNWNRQSNSLTTLELPEHILVGTRVTFGEERQTEKEACIPFVIQEVID